MSQFLLLGSDYLNVDKIASVSVEGPPIRQEMVCIVWFISGNSRQISGDDAKRLLEFLNKNKID